MSDAYQYEMLYVVNATLSDDQTQSVIDRVHKYIESNGGSITDTDRIGNRRLAYPINKKRNGFYVNVYFTAPGDMIPKLERSLQISDEILRYLTLRMDTKMVRHYERTKKRRAEEAAATATATAESE
ncbi:MAG: 30S ribosomal protein S6 [Bacteroidota bacterium]